MLLINKALFLAAFALAPAITFAQCAFENTGTLIEGNPLVKVSPMFPKRQLRKKVEGCVVLGYSLQVRPGTNGRGTVPGEVVVLQASDRGRKAFEKAAKLALAKWLFSSKTHGATDRVTYFSVFRFEFE